MAKLTAAQVAAKYKRRAQAAAPDYTTGVQGVTEAPGEKAAAQQDKMLAKITESITSGKWAKRVAGVSLADWKKATVEKGSARYSTGVAAGEAKMEKFMTEFLPHLEAGAAKINAMPNMNLEDGIARNAAQIRHNASFIRK